ncbi:MAG: DNA-processing protein DprA [Candidatus Omnitrophica bacterium]|nr:DNA-processing protein DprA [Candidatus Omnitrophota bacterium]
MTRQEALLILNAIPALSNKVIQKLLDFFGCPTKILGSNQKELQASGILREQSIQNILEFNHDGFLKNELALIQSHGVELLCIGDDHYPEQLATIPDAPVVLYMKGQLPKNHHISLSIVGSRKASVYGINTAEQFAVRLGELGIPVVSGMARGVDTAAHRGTLKAGGITIAVLGSGLACIYPPENKPLFSEIVSRGAVISEFPMESSPMPYNFPRRNRIISGLSMGVIVVEAALKSGALITADFALEQGREVFAIPGRIDTPSAAGTHKMIQQGAHLITDVDDVLQEFELALHGYLNNDFEQIDTDQETTMPAIQRDVFQYIQDRPVHIDQILEQSSQPSSDVYSALIQLEMKKFIKQLPGKFFVR